ncbi:response regulator transcription factor [Rhodohalobacter sp. 614A]|uniref:response regulator transcription factor n=1 Tax=Rhodohalobacter sp. 614A TaxID=2908649 RepID=UPI001F162EA0|nr:response regulator transcription factor [Rhodohalobacter sp. 614A]
MVETLEDQKLIRVVIIEDNQYIREGWTTILDSDPEVVVKSTYRSCEDALESEDIEWCDIILLDIQLPGILGTEGVEKFLEINPGLAIIMISVMEDSQHIFEALQNGAIGYLIKKVGPDELVRAVKDAYEGGSPMSPVIARKVIASMQTQPKKRDHKLDLTDREKEVLKLLAEGHSYQAIADEIYLSVDGVGYHIRNIYRKLQVNSKAEAVAKGISSGLIKMANS